MTEFGYARADAHRIEGDGPIDTVAQPDWPWNIDLEWDDDWDGPWLRELSSMGRSAFAPCRCSPPPISKRQQEVEEGADPDTLDRVPS